MLVIAVDLLPAALLVEYPDYAFTPVSVVAFASAGLTRTLLREVVLHRLDHVVGVGRTDPL